MIKLLVIYGALYVALVALVGIAGLWTMNLAVAHSVIGLYFFVIFWAYPVIALVALALRRYRVVTFLPYAAVGLAVLIFITVFVPAIHKESLTNEAKPRPIELDSYIDHDIDYRGLAVDTTVGAAVQGDTDRLVIDGLGHWPASVSGKVVQVTGRLKRVNGVLPVRYVLVDAKWSVSK
jgi:uncharacterized membrane protein YuzA (DUF378 family)